ncbi:hypothetical protein E2C01_048455 [Portunus trituberculatus]|uniref:Uncharacterized protein n=1 Tax=Portunus trituberculatus TaxID=210409 RepID=A0A5B7GDF2_PORTR|nr:hypothetical protein [Portunus trituberculatus]
MKRGVAESFAHQVSSSVDIEQACRGEGAQWPFHGHMLDEFRLLCPVKVSVQRGAGQSLSGAVPRLFVVLCGNGISERCHRTVKTIQARTGCPVAQAVYRYNVMPRGNSAASAPANRIFQYEVRLLGIDGALQLQELPGHRDKNCIGTVLRLTAYLATYGTYGWTLLCYRLPQKRCHPRGGRMRKRNTPYCSRYEPLLWIRTMKKQPRRKIKKEAAQKDHTTATTEYTRASFYTAVSILCSVCV